MAIRIDDDKIPDHLVEKFEAEKPSSDPRYWAKSGCKYCHGRGIVGTRTLEDKNNNTVKHELLCICVRKHFKKYKLEWLEKNCPEKYAPPSPKSNGSSKPSAAHTLERIDRIDDQVSILMGQVTQYEEKIIELPYHKEIEELTDEKEKLKSRLHEEENVNRELEKQILSFQYESRRLMERAKELAKQSITLESEITERTKTVISPIVNDLKELDNRLDLKQSELDKHAKSWRRKVKQTTDKIERLQKRRDRISYYGGFESASLDVLDGEHHV